VEFCFAFVGLGPFEEHHRHLSGGPISAVLLKKIVETAVATGDSVTEILQCQIQAPLQI
jgi:hypothetical protein